MEGHPRFKSCYHVEVVENEAVILLDEDEYVVIEGKVPAQLAGLLDGQHSVWGLMQEMTGVASGMEVQFVLAQMEQAGYTTTAPCWAERREMAYWNLMGTDAATASIQPSITVEVLGDVDATPLREALHHAGLQVESSGELGVVLTNNYLQEGLAVYNEAACRTQRPWMLVRPVGKVVWVGPLFVPGQTGCWHCLAMRLRANRNAERYLQSRTGSAYAVPSIATLPSTMRIGCEIAVIEIQRWWKQGQQSELAGTLLTLDTTTLAVQRHQLVRQPACSICGNPSEINGQGTALQLQSRPELDLLSGGSRSMDSEEMYEQFAHHISPITGVVRRLRKMALDDPDGLLHVYAASHNMTNHFETLQDLRDNEREQSFGKGKTDAQARASCLGEALERYSAVFRGDEKRITSSYQRLGAAAIHPNDCMRFSADQYRTRATWNAACLSSMLKVPEPFDEEASIEWTPVWSLTNEVVKYLPTSYLYFGYPRHLAPFSFSDSNGNAAGTNLEEAILQGFLELVERDSVALWWYNRVHRPSVDLDSFHEPYFEALQAYYATIYRDIWVLDITADLGIPAFAALSCRTDREPADMLMGFGCHFNATVAVLRALTEVNQMLPAVSRENKNGTTHYVYPDQMALRWLQTATLITQPYLAPDTMVPPKCQSDYAQPCHNDLMEAVQICVQRAAKQHLEVLVLDQTRADIGLPVVKVVVPGLRHFWKRLAPGRLYDVPAQIGWLGQPHKEQDMNPFPLFV